MNIIRGFLTLLFIIAIIFIISYYIINLNIQNKQETIIYKYIPQTLIQEEQSAIYPSVIFRAMFNQPSTWIDSVDADAIRRQENLNKYFISQY